MKRLLVVVLFAIAVFIPVPATAHVLITDSSQSKGAILHIIPDDDPVAGEQSPLYFDTQEQLLKPDTSSKVTLIIENTTGEKTDVPVKIDGSLVTADYTFPMQGVYKLTYEIVAGNEKYIFTQSQRVSRGAVESALNQPTYAWAEMLIVGTGVGLIVLMIVAFNRRKLIANQSSF